MAQQITKTGYTELQNELKDLRSKLKAIVRRLKTAVAQGDLSENSAYITAKEDLNNTRARIAEIESTLKSALIIQTGSTAVCQVGSIVTLQINGREMTYTLVNPVEANPTENKLSVESAIGQAILGKKPGTTATVTTPSGEQTVSIVSLK